MGKHGWLCLPKMPTASKGFLCTKLFLLTIFLAVFALEVTWTVITMRVYRQKIVDLKAASRWPSRSEIQVYATHQHFFLFTGLIQSAFILVGFWGVLMEYLVVLAGFAYVLTGVILFEIIGAAQSGDDQVKLFKAIGVAPEPILVILALVFAHMVRVAERKLAESPLYKKQMAEKMSKGETGNTMNKPESDESGNESDSDQEEMPRKPNGRTNMNNNDDVVIKDIVKSNGGQDNLAYTIDDEVGRTQLDPGVQEKPRSAAGEGNTAMVNLKDQQEGSDGEGTERHKSTTVTVTGKGQPVDEDGRCCDTCINIEVRGGS